MKSVVKTNWRQPMWTDLLAGLPASITINLKTKSYTVRNNSLQYIYSDDIDEAGVDELVGELARELAPESRWEFQEALSMQMMKRSWSEGRKGYTLLSQMGGSERITLRTDVLFSQGVREKVIELRFDLFDANALLPERTFRAEEYGEL